MNSILNICCLYLKKYTPIPIYKINIYKHWVNLKLNIYSIELNINICMHFQIKYFFMKR